MFRFNLYGPAEGASDQALPTPGRLNCQCTGQRSFVMMIATANDEAGIRTKRWRHTMTL